MPSNQVQQTSLPTIQIQRDIVPVVAPTNTIVGTHIYMVSDALEIIVNGIEVQGWTFTEPSTFLLPVTLTTTDVVVIKRTRAVQGIT